MEVYIPVVFTGKTDNILGVYTEFYQAQMACLADLSEFGVMDDLEVYIYRWEIGDEYYKTVFDYDKKTKEWTEKKI
jgi:hypothetical protein